MCEKDKQIDDYRLQHPGQSVVIDERDSPIASIFRIVFGMSIAVWTVAGILHLVFYNGRPDFSKYTTGSWFILAFLFCIMILSAYGGLFVAFARERVEAKSENILAGNTWFGVPVRLKIVSVSEITAIKLDWECQGVFGKRWACVGSIISKKMGSRFHYFPAPKWNRHWNWQMQLLK